MYWLAASYDRAPPLICFRHRHADAVLTGYIFGVFVSSVGMANNADAGIGCEHSFETARAGRAAFRDGDHPCVLCIPNAHTTTVVNGHPGCACGRVEKRVEQRPVRDGIGA